MPAPAASRYVVSRRNWRRTPAGFVRLPGETAVASFPTRVGAEADLWARETGARAVANPFAAGLAPFEQTSLPPPVFRDWLLDAGVEPPAAFADPGAWGQWWDEASPEWTESQRLKVWEGLDKCRFFAVAERPPAAVVYAVVEVVWQYQDFEYGAEGEGGKMLTAYRHRDRAEAECNRRNLESREQMADINDEDPDDPTDGRFDYVDRERLLADPFHPPPPRPPKNIDGWLKSDEVPFYEVVEVELEGDK